MRTRKRYLDRGALFLALWVVIAAGLLAAPFRNVPQHGFSTAIAAAAIPLATAATQPALHVQQQPTQDRASTADQKYQEARRANRRKRILVVAALVYLPPFLILVIGWVIARVARGLRSA